MTVDKRLNEKDERVEEFTKVLNSKLVGPAIHPTYTKKFVRWLSENGYFDVPASISHHGTNTGDLFRHSLAVARILDDYTRALALEWQRWCSPWVVGLFHDLCKMDEYIYSEQLDIRDLPRGWEHNERQLLNGHGDKSVMLLSQFITLTEEELLCMRYHMGAYNKEDWNGFDLAIRKYPNVLYTHMADMYASKVMDI